MALAAVVTRKSVSLQDGIFIIVLNCEIKEGEIVLWEGTGSGRYNPNNPNLDTTKNAILLEMKNKYDRWRSEKEVYDSATLDATLGDLETIITNYVNQ